MTATEKPLTEKQQFWFQHLSAWKESGFSASRYAENHSLNPQHLYSWKWYFKTRTNESILSRNKRLKKSKLISVENDFIPVEIMRESASCAIQFKNDKCLSLNYRLTPIELAALIRELSQ